MALAPNSGLETLTLVLTKAQAARIRTLAALRSSDHQRVTLSDVGREVVEEGLRVVLHRPNTGSTANADPSRALNEIAS